MPGCLGGGVEAHTERRAGPAPRPAPWQYNPRRHLQHTQQFAERYSVRERRTVDFFNPAAVMGSQGEHQGGRALGGSAGREREQERERRRDGNRDRDRSSRKRSRHERGGAASPEDEQVGGVAALRGGPVHVGPAARPALAGLQQEARLFGPGAC